MHLSKRGFCIWFNNIVCSFQKYDKPVVLNQCFSCAHHTRFLGEMGDDDERFMAEIDTIHRVGYDFFDRFVSKRV